MIHRARVRGYDGRVIEKPIWTATRIEAWFGCWALNLMLIRVSTRFLRHGARLTEGDLLVVAGKGTSCVANTAKPLSCPEMDEHLSTLLDG